MQRRFIAARWRGQTRGWVAGSDPVLTPPPVGEYGQPKGQHGERRGLGHLADALVLADLEIRTRTARSQREVPLIGPGHVAGTDGAADEGRIGQRGGHAVVQEIECRGQQLGLEVARPRRCHDLAQRHAVVGLAHRVGVDELDRIVIRGPAEIEVRILEEVEVEAGARGVGDGDVLGDVPLPPPATPPSRL